MNATKHTPGPWKVVPTVWAGGSNHYEGPGVFSIQDAATETVICDRRTQWPERVAEMEANAHLIVTAPDMLEKLEQALEFVADHEDVIDGDNGPLPNRAMTLAVELRAVIAKATGSTQ